MGQQNQYRNTLFVEGIGPIGVFDTWSGGEADSDEVKHSDGGMGAERAYGGRQTVGNVTVGRVWKRDRDTIFVRKLMAVRGRATCSAHRQPLDAHGNAYGDPFITITQN